MLENDQLRIPYVRLYGKLFQVGDQIAPLVTMAVWRRLSIHE